MVKIGTDLTITILPIYIRLYIYIYINLNDFKENVNELYSPDSSLKFCEFKLVELGVL